MSSVKRIQAGSLSTKIADALREAILTGELRQGDPITQDAVAKEYDVSTMPAREALLMLSHEGVMEARPNRGFRVVRMHQQDVEDIYWTHGVLAGRLTARACERLTDAEIDELSQNCEQIAAAVQSKRMDEVEALNSQFHRVINLAADSPKILALLKSTVNQVPKHFYTMIPSWGELSVHDHSQLLRALRKRDAAKAEKAAVTHVAAAGKLMVQYLASQGYWTDEEHQATS